MKMKIKFLEILDKIQKHRQVYEKSEIAVREQIITPILKVLGWDTENPEQVRPNISYEEGIPDYTLIVDNEKEIFLEAKNLRVNVEDDNVINQVARYCFGEGTKFGIITNGADWIVFKSFEEKIKLKERILLKAHLEKGNLDDFIKKLSFLSRDKIGDLENNLMKNKNLEKLWEIFITNSEVNEILKRLLKTESDRRELIQFFTEKLKREFKEEKGPVSKNGEEDNPPRDLPRTLRLGEDIIKLEFTKDVLRTTANWLIDKGKLTSSHCPIETPLGKHYLINSKNKDKDGEPFYVFKQLKNGLFLYYGLDPKTAIRYSKYLLRKLCGTDEIMELTK